MNWLPLLWLPVPWLPVIVFGVTCVEFAVVCVAGRRWGVSPLEGFLLLLPGAALTGALWLALVGYGVKAIGAALVVAGAAHAADVWWRVRRRPS